MMRTRAIQIGLARDLSKYYTDHIISIQDVTNLAKRIGAAHGLKGEKATTLAMDALQTELPHERPYLPDLPPMKLLELGMLPGPAADVIQQIGRGNVEMTSESK